MARLHLTKRKGFWYYARRVPNAFKAFDPRHTIFISTGIRITDDPRAKAAKDAIIEINNGIERYWHEAQTGLNPDPNTTYQKAVAIAQSHGLPYQPITAVTQLPKEQFFTRLDVLQQLPATKDNASAILGTVPQPSILLSGLVDEVQSILAPSLNTKSPRQLQKWRKARDTTVAEFIKVIGADIAITDLTRTHARKYQTYWSNRVLNHKLRIDTANKSLGRMSAMFKAVNEHHQLELPNIFEKIYIAGSDTGQRTAFDPEFVQNELLKTGALDSLNPEARAILFVMAETGIRIAEACNLNKSTIDLASKVPHIRIRPDNRQMKTKHSAREIPLVGVALKALEAFPDGFPRYLDKADVVSATINKYLSSNFQLQEGQTLYSLRHTFEDRLTAAEAPEKITATLMGHKWHRPKYGKGPTLDQKAEWLNKIAFTAPSRI